MAKTALTKNEGELKEALKEAMTFASHRMVVLETLDNKNQDYRDGFFDGLGHQTDFIIALLSPTIEGLKQTIDQTLKARGLQS